MFQLYSHKHCEIAKLFLAYQHLKKKDCFHLSQFDPGGGYSPIKVTGMLVGKIRENPQKLPESCFMGVLIQQQQII